MPFVLLVLIVAMGLSSKIDKKFNTLEYSGGTTHCSRVGGGMKDAISLSSTCSPAGIKFPNPTHSTPDLYTKALQNITRVDRVDYAG